jgi:hypothetical protein
MNNPESGATIVSGEAGGSPKDLLATKGHGLIWKSRVGDWLRHVKDLQTQTYEGAQTRPEKEKVFRTAFDLLTPVARRVLDDLNSSYLENSGELTVRPPASDGRGGLVGEWSLSWPLLKASKSRFTGEPLDPLTLFAIFPLTPTGAMVWMHPHLALLRSVQPDGIAAAWPLQVTSPEDAERQEPVLRVMAETEMHERTYLADINWRILPLVTYS